VLNNALSGVAGDVDYASWGPTYMTSNLPLDAAFPDLEFVDLHTMWSIAFGAEENPF
jgi:hypothetical protein